MEISVDKLTTFCLIYAVTPAAEDAFRLAHNEKYLAPTRLVVKRRRRSREGTPTCDASRPVLALTFNVENMYDPRRGHSFGSNEGCDFLLGQTNELGVSGFHFRLCLDYERDYPERLFLYDISSHGTEVDGVVHHNAAHTRLPVNRRVTVAVGPYVFSVPNCQVRVVLKYWRPKYPYLSSTTRVLDRN